MKIRLDNYLTQEPLLLAQTQHECLIWPTENVRQFELSWLPVTKNLAKIKYFAFAKGMRMDSHYRLVDIG